MKIVIAILTSFLKSDGKVVILTKFWWKIQFLNINIIPLVERKDVFFILTTFPKKFWNK